MSDKQCRAPIQSRHGSTATPVTDQLLQPARKCPAGRRGLDLHQALPMLYVVVAKRFTLSGAGAARVAATFTVLSLTHTSYIHVQSHRRYLGAGEE